jgi:hypothetical protein
MTDTTLTREIVQDRLNAVREKLLASIAGRSEAELQAIRVTPAWSALDVLRHTWVWNELTARSLADWHGPRDWMLTFANEDVFNIEMVAARSSAGLVTVLAAIDSAHQRYAATLDRCSDAELDEPDAAPWGQQMSRLAMIYDILAHDLEHIAQLASARADLHPTTD